MSAPRTRSPWIDARFLIGVALVLASMIGVYFVVSSARATVSVAVADTTLVPGQAVTDDSVRWVEVALGESTSTYLTALSEDQVATRVVPAGELIAADAVIDADRNAVTTVVITSSSHIASTVTVGSAVEVWVSTARDRELSAATVLIDEAIVAGVRQSSGIGSTGAVTLELVISRSLVGDVLDAQASQSVLWAVPLGGVR